MLKFSACYEFVEFFANALGLQDLEVFRLNSDLRYHHHYLQSVFQFEDGTVEDAWKKLCRDGHQSGYILPAPGIHHLTLLLQDVPCSNLPSPEVAVHEVAVHPRKERLLHIQVVFGSDGAAGIVKDINLDFESFSCNER